MEEGIKPHKLPDTPADVEDDGHFRLVVLGADYAGVVGDKPLDKAQDFIRTHSSADGHLGRIRTYVLVVTPSVTGLHQAEQQIAEWLAWEEIENSGQFKEMDDFQQKTVRDKKRETLKDAQTAVKNTYELVLYLEKDGSIQAKKITLGAQSLFATLLQETALRIFREKIDAEAIMPNGLYPVWPPIGSACSGLRSVSAVWARPPASKALERQDRSQHNRGCCAARGSGRALCPQRSVRSVVLALGNRDGGLGKNAEAWLPGQATLNALSSASGVAFRPARPLAEDRRWRQTLRSLSRGSMGRIAMRKRPSPAIRPSCGRSQRWITPS